MATPSRLGPAICRSDTPPDAPGDSRLLRGGCRDAVAAGSPVRIVNGSQRGVPLTPGEPRRDAQLLIVRRLIEIDAGLLRLLEKS